MKAKRTFKTISSILAAALLATSISVVPVSAAKPEVYMFETMGNGFQRIYGPHADPNSGYVDKPVYGFITKSKASGFGYLLRGTINRPTETYDEVAYNTYLQHSGDDANLIENMFGTVVDSGKLHISYSAMPISETNELRIFVNNATDKLDSDNATIKVDGYDADNESQISKNVFMSNNKVWLSENSDGVSNRGTLATLTTNNWYKVDIIYDLDNDNFTAYLNGEILGTEGFYSAGIKGIHGSYDKESGTSTAYTTSLIKNFALDDFYIHSYEGAEKVYFATEGVKELEDGTFYIAVSSSEYVNSLADLVTLVDVATGEEVYPDNIEARADGQLCITLPAECAGMDIMLLADVVEQTTSGATDVEDFIFTVPGENVNKVNEYYFVNDSFDGLDQGMAPVTYSSQNAVVTAKGAGKAVTLTDGTLTKKFAQSTPVNGEFSIEFDIKRNGAYTLDAMLYGAENAKVNLLTANADGAVSFAADRGENLTVSTLTSANAWEHVKINVDMASEKLNIQMGANTAEHQITLKGMLAAGISGITFGGSAEVDNVKIYKTVKYYLYDDFNDMNSSFAKYTYWNRINTEQNLSEHIDSRGTETGATLAKAEAEAYDRAWFAMKDYYTSNGWFDPKVTKGSVLDGEDADKEHKYFSQTKAFAVTPVMTTDAKEVGSIEQAEVAGPGNYWTKEKADAGDKVLFVGPRLVELRESEDIGPKVMPKQRRIVKYFDRSISEGTPFTMEFLMKAPSTAWSAYRVGAFGFSLIEKGQDPSNYDNLLMGFSGVATVNTGIHSLGYGNAQKDHPLHQLAWFAPDTDTSLATELESKLEGSKYFKSSNGKYLSQGSWLKNGQWENESKLANILPTGTKLHKVKITVTPNSDGTTTITYEHEKNASETYKGSVIVARDFNSKEFVGLALDTYDLTWVGNKADDVNNEATLVQYYDDSYLIKGNHGMMYDDFMIYETGATNPGGIYIKSIAGADYEYNQNDIEDGISGGAKAVAVNFSASVASSSARTNGIISLIDAETGAVVETTKEISADGKTVYVIPNGGFTGGKAYYLAIDNNLEFSPNNASQLNETKLYSFECVEGDAFGIIESKLMDPITRNGELTYEYLKPAKSKTILANALGGETTRLYVDGFSKEGGEDMVAVIAYYTTNNGMDTLADTQWLPFTSEIGSFTKYFNLNTTENFDKVRAYVWTADGNYKPLVNAVGLAALTPEVTD